jgi:hypothetical protein
MNKYSISQVGSVKLSDGSNEMYGNINDCWTFGRDKGMTALLFLNLKGLRAPVGKQKYKWKVVVTSSSLEQVKQDYKIGSAQSFSADQSGRNLGDWELVDMVEWSLAGLKRIANMTHKKSIMMATYK